MKFLVLSLMFAVASADLFVETVINDDGSGDTDGPTKPSEDKMSFKDKVDAIHKLMKVVIANVHPDEKGFVPHEDIEKPGKEIVDIAVKIKKLMIKAMKPMKISRLVKQDLASCKTRLRKAFEKKLPQREIEKQAGQCFFVIHRPFVVLLRHALQKGLFDEVKDVKEDIKTKRGIVELVHDLRKIQFLLGKFSDGKPDFPYVFTLLRMIKEGSEYSKEIRSAARLFIHDYIVLSQRMVSLVKQNKTEEAQILAGRAYLSFFRRMLKVLTVLHHRAEGSSRPRPSRKPRPSGAPHPSGPRRPSGRPRPSGEPRPGGASRPSGTPRPRRELRPSGALHSIEEKVDFK